MDYGDVETGKLQKMAQRMRYDSDHLLDTHQRELAETELRKVEAELKKRKGVSGIIYQIGKWFGSGSK